MGLLIGLALLTLAVLVMGWLKKVRYKKCPTVVEYWVFSNVLRVPPMEAIIDSMVAKNPFNPPGDFLITVDHGMLFRDVRLRLSVALRDKNPLAFRPDLMESDVEVDAECLQLLADSTSLVKAVYASPEPISHRRHLRFMTHMVSALGRLTKGTVVYDVEARKLFSLPKFNQALQEDPDGESRMLHVRVIWKVGEPGATAESFGLRKVGQKDFSTAPQELDHRVLVTEIAEKLVDHLFTGDPGTYPFSTSSSGDVFTVVPLGQSHDRETVKILRQLG
ncbi:MAG: hypothetical protein JNM34_11150 [Chthonomonadaceae bacterium]|nr:hypothetical protein [Chthonomonadaceae bacterium]